MRRLQRHEGTIKLIRARLHAIADRREDRLVFDLQTAVAESFGIKPGKGQRASEVLMHRYYWAAKAVSQLNKILMLNIEERITGSENQPMRPLNERFFDRGGLLEVARDDLYLTDRTAILETFLIYQQVPGIKALCARTLRALYQARDTMDGSYRRDPAVRAQFMEILKQPLGQTHAFRLMNETSVLGRTLWVFRRIVGRMQHDLFHVYTVDQHILMVLRNVRRFFIPEHAHEYPFCSQLASQWDKPWILYVAALFHDVAKGRGGDHSVLGGAEARRFCREHAIEKDDAALIEFLVRHHLTMSHIAQKEDLSDPEVITAFAKQMGNPRRLAALYLLTVADIRGTSPKVWNAWKGKLLEDLYRLTLRVLGGATPNMDAEIEARKLEARNLLALRSALPGTEKPLWDTLDVSYFARHDAMEIAWHARVAVAPREDRRAGGQRAAVAGGRRAAGAGVFARPRGPVRAHLRLLRQRRLLDPGRQDPHQPRRLRARHVPGRAPGVRRRRRGGLPRPDLADRNQPREGAAGRGPAARAEPRPRVAARALVPGDAARQPAPRRARAALDSLGERERPLGPAVRHRARAGAAPREPAAGQDLDARRARGRHLPGRRRGAAAQPRAARDRDRAARRHRSGGDACAGRSAGLAVTLRTISG